MHWLSSLGTRYASSTTDLNKNTYLPLTPPQPSLNSTPKKKKRKKKRKEKNCKQFLLRLPQIFFFFPPFLPPAGLLTPAPSFPPLFLFLSDAASPSQRRLLPHIIPQRKRKTLPIVPTIKLGRRECRRDACLLHHLCHCGCLDRVVCSQSSRR